MPNSINAIVDEILESKVVVDNYQEHVESSTGQHDFYIMPTITFNEYKSDDYLGYSNYLDKKYQTLKIQLNDIISDDKFGDTVISRRLILLQKQLSVFLKNYEKDCFNDSLNGKGKPLTHPNIRFIWQKGAIETNPIYADTDSMVEEYSINSWWHTKKIKELIYPFSQIQLRIVRELLKIIDNLSELINTNNTDKTTSRLLWGKNSKLFFILFTALIDGGYIKKVNREGRNVIPTELMKLFLVKQENGEEYSFDSFKQNLKKGHYLPKSSNDKPEAPQLKELEKVLKRIHDELSRI